MPHERAAHRLSAAVQTDGGGDRAFPQITDGGRWRRERGQLRGPREIVGGRAVVWGANEEASVVFS